MSLRYETERFFEKALREFKDKVDRMNEAPLSSSDARDMSQCFFEQMSQREFKDTILSELCELFERIHHDIVKDTEYKFRDKLEGKTKTQLQDLVGTLQRDQKRDLMDQIDDLERAIDRWFRQWNEGLSEIPEQTSRL